MDVNDAVFTVEEVADMLRVSKMTVYRLINQGELSYVRIGRTFRIPAIAFDEYVQANTHKAAFR